MEAKNFDLLRAKPFWVSGVWVDPQSNTIKRGTTESQVERQVMLLLLFLASRRGTVVSRDVILETLWPDSPYNDEALTQATSKLRKALENPDSPDKLIRTVRKVGYCLMGTLSEDTSQKAVQTGLDDLGPEKVTHLVASPPVRNWMTAAVFFVGIMTALNATFILSKPSPESQPKEAQWADISAFLGAEFDVTGVDKVIIKHANGSANENTETTIAEFHGPF